MKLKEHLSALGRGAASLLGRRIGVSPVLISQWANGDRPTPIERCVAIERATSGAVTRRDLRPDDWRDIWPELSDASVSEPTTSEVGHD
ncbi:MAG: helix-turn-helix domain-containing protein [Comamonas sp.]|jgi:DNA-binding transcriptional regulator YdaS (Cro superfamily)|uniref:transcriptional regulator n=1 Tax=Comamonas sp. TaxID=34028 RepID=UPI00283291C2|nr:YdaS family helix-turn-helix protein [Comamonas sp.]MDR0215936.1 helix-turn-helix domain-containing protein [Comamonas sp.]